MLFTWVRRQGVGTDSGRAVIGPGHDAVRQIHDAGGRRLASIAAARAGSAHEVVAAISEAVQVFQGAAELADDLSLVAVGRRAGRRRRTVAPS